MKWSRRSDYPPHGAQGIMGVEPDLTVFGKVIAGGYPGAGGVGGKEEFRKYLAAGIQTGDKVKKALVGGTMLPHLSLPWPAITP